MLRILSAALVAACLAAAAPAADAQSARQAQRDVEVSMLVTGHVDIAPDGRTTAHALDQPQKLPPYVVELIEGWVPRLDFEPVRVDGVAVRARARMRVRLVATPGADDAMHMGIVSAHFGEAHSDTDRTSVRTAARLRLPVYPADVQRMGGKGTVYLLLKVGRDGKPQEVFTEQVNLTALGTARQMQRVRAKLSKAAMDTARRHWTFLPPDEGREAALDHWIVRVPVEFSFFGDTETPYGQWSAYHPGQWQRPTWAAPVAPGFRPDVLMAGEVTPETSRFTLLTPLGS